MSPVRLLVRLITTVTLVAIFLVGFAILMTIGMSKSGPSFGEALSEYWPVGAALALIVGAEILNRTKPMLAAVPAAGAAGLMIWFFKFVMRV